MNFVNIENYGIYTCSLNFKDDFLNNIIKDIYTIEKDGKYSSEGRTFIINKGFHSVNILDQKYNILEKWPNIKILVSRVQEILFNEFYVKDIIDFVNFKYGSIRIKEIWINILRKTDYNLPHHHANNDISGNFYLNTITKKNNKNDGNLLFIKYGTQHYLLPDKVKKNEGNNIVVSPVKNLGVLFQSHFKHIVLPHFSDEDRIGIAFNAVFDKNYSYDMIYPIPYWLPFKYSCVLNEKNLISLNENKHRLSFKNGLYIDIINKKQKDQKIDLNKNDLEKFNHLCTIDRKEIFGNLKKTRLIEDKSDDYFTSKNKFWKDTDSYYYENNNSDKLIIIFSGMGSDNKPTFIFQNFLSNYNCDKLFLRDLTFSWFLNNNLIKIDKNDTPIMGIYNFIKSYIKKRHKSVFSIGCSSGGFASILYSHLLKIDKCVVFSPQTVIGEKKELMGDHRFKEVSDNTEKNTNDIFLDLKNCIPFKTNTTIFYCNELDEIHAKHVKNKNCEIIKINNNTNINSHLVALIMKKNGMLKKIFDKLFT